MAYQNDIPKATDRLKDSQSDIQDNFAELETYLEINHVEFGNANQGKHKWVTFPAQTVAPTFASGEEGLYNLPFNNNTSVLNELFVHKQTSTGTSDIPFTASILSQNATPASLAAGWSYLPSGLLVKWGSASGNGTTTVNLPGTDPAFNTIFNVLLTPFAAGSSDSNFSVRFIGLVSPSQFQVYVSSRTNTGAAPGAFQFLVIGR